MAGASILSLPVLELERYLDSPLRLHRRCIETYRLAGLAPEPDAVFHFAAALWRFRGSETAAQIAALAAAFLRALSRQTARPRRDPMLEGATGALLRLVESAVERAAREPHSARLLAETSRREMASDRWRRDLERWSAAYAVTEPPPLDWSQPLPQLLARLAPADGSSADSLVQRLRRELAEYRELADAARARLQEMSEERLELESRMDGKSGQSERAVRAEVARLQGEVTRLSEELLAAMDRAAAAELTAERLMSQLDLASSDRMEAAETLGMLSRRLETVQNEADRTLEAAQRRATAAEAEAERLRAAFKESRRAQDELKERVAALEPVTGRASELESVLQQAQKKVAALEQEVSRARGTQEREKAERERLEGELRRRAEAESERDRIRAELAARDQQLEALRKALSEKEQEVATWRNRSQSVEEQIKEDTGRLRKLEEQMASLRAEIATLEDRRRRAESELGETREREHHLTMRVSERQAQTLALEQELQQEREERRAEREVAQLKLKAMEERLAALSEHGKLLEADRHRAEEALRGHDHSRARERAAFEAALSGTRRGHDNGTAELERRLYETEARLAQARQQARVAEEHRRELHDLASRAADLRLEFESAADDDARNRAASTLARAIDSLFAATGRPIRADRRTEKILVLHVARDEDAGPVPGGATERVKRPSTGGALEAQS
jgi:chromosome segregation ATPase